MTTNRKIRGTVPTSRLTRMVRKAGLTMQEFADAVGTTIGNARVWAKRGVTAQYREKAAKVLGVDVARIPRHRGERPARQPRQQPVQPVQADVCKCGGNLDEYKAKRREQAAQQMLCGGCNKPRVHIPEPTGPVAPPLMRLRKCGTGIIGAPWIEIVAIAPGLPDRFYDTTRYLCRLPGRETCYYKWFTHTDLHGSGGDYGEYEEE